MEGKQFKASKAKIVYYYPFIFENLKPIKGIVDLKETHKTIQEIRKRLKTKSKDIEGIDFNLGEEFKGDKHKHMRDYVSLLCPRLRFRWVSRNYKGDIQICHYPTEEVKRIKDQEIEISSKVSLFWNGAGVVRIVLNVKKEIGLEEIISLANLGELYPSVLYTDGGDFISCKIGNDQIVLFEETFNCIKCVEESIQELFIKDGKKYHWMDSFDPFQSQELPFIWPDFMTVDDLYTTQDKLQNAIKKGWARPFPLVGLELRDVDKDNFEKCLFFEKPLDSKTRKKYLIGGKDSFFNDILISLLFRSLDTSYASEGFKDAFIVCDKDRNIANMSANRKQFFHCGHKAAVFLCSSFDKAPANYSFATLESTVGLTLLEYYPLKFLIQYLDRNILTLSLELTREQSEKPEGEDWRKRIFRIKTFAVTLLQNYVRLRVGTGSLKESYEVFRKKLGVEKLLDMVKFRISQLDSFLQWYIEIKVASETKDLPKAISEVENMLFQKSTKKEQT